MFQSAYTYDLLGLIKYPEREQLKAAFSQDNLLLPYATNLIHGSLLDLILRGEIVLYSVHDSHELLNGRFKDLKHQYLLTRSTMVDQPKAPIYGLLTTKMLDVLPIDRGDDLTQALSVSVFIERFVQSLLDPNTDYDLPLKTLLAQAVKYAHRRLYWVNLKREETQRWFLLREVKSVEIDPDQRKNLSSELIKVNQQIGTALRTIPLLKQFNQDFKNRFEQELSFYKEA